ncbi:MAG: energy transducer TonB [Lewinellaceae bacterium]|nr:energy transducer TonB [Lewinellaceae bacterium]
MMKNYFLLFVGLLSFQLAAQNLPTRSEALNNRARFNPVEIQNHSEQLGIMVDTMFRHAGYEIKQVGVKYAESIKGYLFEIEFKGGAPIKKVPVVLLYFKYKEREIYRATWITRANTADGIVCQIENIPRPIGNHLFVLVPEGEFTKPTRKELQKLDNSPLSGTWWTGMPAFRYPPLSPDDDMDFMVVEAPPVYEQTIGYLDLEADEVVPPPPVAVKMESFGTGGPANPPVRVTEKAEIEEMAPPTVEVEAVMMDTPVPPPPSDPDRVYEIFELSKPAAFPDGEQALKQFLAQNMKYPVLARENAIQGKVVVSFVVDRDGNLSDIKLVRDIGAGCGVEALRLVGMMPAWTPGTLMGYSVRSKFTLLVEFKLN